MAQSEDRKGESFIRDGSIASWELNLRTKRRRRRYGEIEYYSTESDESGEESAEDGQEVPEQDEEGWVELEDLNNPSIRQKSRMNRTERSGIVFEDQWEIEHDEESNSSPSSSFRQSADIHNQAVSALALVDYNRTLVSTSDDATVMAWRPHSDQPPTQIGSHSDYIRGLTASREAGWVASGGFDGLIKLWDINESRSSPIVEISMPESTSIYTLASTPSGTAIAVGEPGRVVRVFDPRSNSKRPTSQFAGHTDMIRQVLISDDGTWLLSGSSDSSIKLWSVSNQKCLETFSYHASSVFSLFSQHPRLERFYSGDRSGVLCKVDFEGCGNPSDGEAVVISAGEGSINAIVARDDAYIWTASGSNDINRWRDIPSRSKRAGAVYVKPRVTSQLDSESTDRLLESTATSISDHHSDKTSLPASVAFERTSTLSRTTSSPSTPFSNSIPLHHPTIRRPTSLRTPAVSSSRRSTLLSFIASPVSKPDDNTLFDLPYTSLVPLSSPDNFIVFREASTNYSTTSFHRPTSINSHHSPVTTKSTLNGFQSLPEVIAAVTQGQADSVARKEYLDRETASEAIPLRSKCDEIIRGQAGLLRCLMLNDRIHVLAIDTGNDVTLWNIVTATCLGVFEREETSSIASRGRSSTASQGSQVSAAIQSRSILESVKEQIESENATLNWCTVEARGQLIVHLDENSFLDAEIYADELGGLTTGTEYPADHRINLGQWILRSLFDDFVSAQVLHSCTPAATRSPALQDADNVTTTPTRTFNSDAPTFISLAGLSRPPLSLSIPDQKTPFGTATPALRQALPPDVPASLLTSTRFVSPTPDAATPTARFPSTSAPLDYFSLPPTSPVTPSTASDSTPAPLLSPSVPTPGGRMYGRLRFGRKKNEEKTAPPSPVIETPSETVLTVEQQQQLHRTQLLANLTDPLPLTEFPPLDHDRSRMTILISEKGEGAIERRIYRSALTSIGLDRAVVLKMAPTWLIETLFHRMVKDVPKLSFLLVPVVGTSELRNANARLTANRNLRISKVITYIHEKLDPSPSPTTRTVRNRSISSHHSLSNPDGTLNAQAVNLASVLDERKENNDEEDEEEAVLEISCGGMVLPNRTTLAVIKTYYWKGAGSDMILNYRYAAN